VTLAVKEAGLQKSVSTNRKYIRGKIGGMVHPSIENDKVAFMAKDYHHGARKYLVTLIYFKGGRDPPSHSR